MTAKVSLAVNNNVRAFVICRDARWWTEYLHPAATWFAAAQAKVAASDLVPADKGPWVQVPAVGSG